MQETIIEIPLDQWLYDSPFNPRSVFDQGKLEELAQSMRPPHGRVLQPIVVRPHQAGDHDVGHQRWDIVFGHRRRRAAELAGLPTIPAIVRAMSDEEVKLAQVVENLQREDVSAIDEADALDALRGEHKASIEDLMRHAGKSRSYVYNRLRLASAHGDVREAVIEGTCDAEIAQEIARLPKPLQPKALAAVSSMSFRWAKNELTHRFQFKLSAAPFDQLSIKLLPEAGACDACPKRSDREPVLLDECGPDVCMDGECYGKKATIAREIRDNEERQRQAQAKPAPTASDGGPWPFQRHQGELLEGEAGGGKANGNDEAEDYAAGDAEATQPAERSRWVDELPPQERVLAEEWPTVEAALVTAVVAAPRSTDDLRMLLRRELEFGDGSFCGQAIDAMGWRLEFDDAVDADQLTQHRIATATADQLGALLIIEALCNDGAPYKEAPGRRLEVCKRYGIDPLAVAASERAADAAQGDLLEAATAVAQQTINGGVKKKGMKYRNAATGDTWSGKGLKPKWLQVALTSGRQLSEFAL